MNFGRKLINDITGAQPKTKDENFESLRNQEKAFAAAVRKLKDVVEKFAKDVRNVPKDFSEAATQFDNLTGGTGSHPSKRYAANVESANTAFVTQITQVQDKLKSMVDRLTGLEKKIKERDDALLDLEHKQSALEQAQRSGKSDKISEANGKVDVARSKYEDLHQKALSDLTSVLDDKNSWSDDVYSGWANAHADVFRAFSEAKVL
eukprot:TRINITY_DN1432_c0_g1_i1.p1 TRINITY_DN1432_c0_g1~~TRINITY_DN1432_c0_g1_i1.p1  ORF type:complete len:206 (+),score=56.50 TRINITY_DN1432_c0_g1_i1:70-687(+)